MKADDVGEIDIVELGLLDWFKKEADFRGVKVIGLSFTDEKLTKLAFKYDAATQWPGVEDFAAQLSKTIPLPSAWRLPTNVVPERARIMDCDGFRVIATAGNGESSFLGFVDTAAEKTVEERRASLEEKKRQSFKP